MDVDTEVSMCFLNGLRDQAKQEVSSLEVIVLHQDAVFLGKFCFLLSSTRKARH